MDFMGKPMEYWMELDMRADTQLSDTKLIQEVAELRAKVSFYESRIEQMVQVMKGDNKQ